MCTVVSIVKQTGRYELPRYEFKSKERTEMESSLLPRQRRFRRHVTNRRTHPRTGWEHANPLLCGSAHSLFLGACANDSFEPRSYYLNINVIGDATRYTWILQLISRRACACTTPKFGSHQIPADWCIPYMRSQDLDSLSSWRNTTRKVGAANYRVIIYNAPNCMTHLLAPATLIPLTAGNRMAWLDEIRTYMAAFTKARHSILSWKTASYRPHKSHPILILSSHLLILYGFLAKTVYYSLSVSATYPTHPITRNLISQFQIDVIWYFTLREKHRPKCLRTGV
jgi:hypothetical protein